MTDSLSVPFIRGGFSKSGLAPTVQGEGRRTEMGSWHLV